MTQPQTETADIQQSETSIPDANRIQNLSLLASKIEDPVNLAHSRALKSHELIYASIEAEHSGSSVEEISELKHAGVSSPSDSNADLQIAARCVETLMREPLSTPL